MISWISNLLAALGRLPGLSFLESARRNMDTSYHRAMQAKDDVDGTSEDFKHAGGMVAGRDPQSPGPGDTSSAKEEFPLSAPAEAAGGDRPSVRGTIMAGDEPAQLFAPRGVQA